MESATPSYDGKQVAVSYSAQGAEISTIKIMNVDTKQFNRNSIFPSAGFSGWTFDNKSVFYSWIKSADSKDLTSLLNSKTKLHTLNADISTDADFFSNESYPDMHIDSSVYPFVFLEKDSKNYIFRAKAVCSRNLKCIMLLSQK